MTQAAKLAAVGSPGVSLGMKNRIINGAMVIDQRNAGASVTPAANVYTYTVDRWSAYCNQASKFTVQQVASTYNGFNYALKATSSSAYTLVNTDIFVLDQMIEGFNVADLGWGTANAKTVTLSFIANSSLTGTFGGSIQNSAQSRSYPFTYTISSANTDTPITVTIAGDTAGTWLTTNGIGMRVYFGLGCGSVQSGTAGAWTGTSYYSATGAVSVISTNAATLSITGVQLEVGASATGFEYRQYGQELALCQRYYAQAIRGAYPSAVGSTAYSTAGTVCSCSFPVTMRTTPTLAIYANGTLNLMHNVNTGATISAPPAQTWWTATNILGIQSSSPFTAGLAYGFDYTASAEL